MVTIWKHQRKSSLLRRWKGHAESEKENGCEIISANSAIQFICCLFHQKFDKLYIKVFTNIILSYTKQ